MSKRSPIEHAIVRVRLLIRLRIVLGISPMAMRFTTFVSRSVFTFMRTLVRDSRGRSGLRRAFTEVTIRRFSKMGRYCQLPLRRCVVRGVPADQVLADLRCVAVQPPFRQFKSLSALGSRRQLGLDPGPTLGGVLGIHCSFPAVQACFGALWAVLSPAQAAHGWVEIALSELQAPGVATLRGLRRLSLAGR